MNYRVSILNEFENDISTTNEEVMRDEESHPQEYIVTTLKEAKKIIL